MPNNLSYLTHPQVVVDATLLVPDWSLSDVGRMRVKELSSNPSLATIGRIISSAETKAVETATMLADALHMKVEQVQATHENDRSSTGYLEAEEFEKAANAFFAHPKTSFKGWETAIDAQQRIVREINKLMAEPIKGDLMVVGHGAVGTLLYCHFAGHAIDRQFDQTGGGGNYFSIDLATHRPLHHWKPMEEFRVVPE